MSVAQDTSPHGTNPLPTQSALDAIAVLTAMLTEAPQAPHVLIDAIEDPREVIYQMAVIITEGLDDDRIEDALFWYQTIAKAIVNAGGSK